MITKAQMHHQVVHHSRVKPASEFIFEAATGVSVAKLQEFNRRYQAGIWQSKPNSWGCCSTPDNDKD